MEQIINAFLTPEILGTFAGTVAATILFTQLLKEWPLINRIPTRIFSYFVALAVLLVVNIVFGQPVTAGSIVLCIFNALVVSLAAQGGFEFVAGGTHTSKILSAVPLTSFTGYIDNVQPDVAKSTSAAAKVQSKIQPPDAGA